MRKLDKPVEQFGEQVTEEVGRITFSGGTIRPGEFQDFGLSLGVPEGKPGSKLTFKSLQTYSSGEVVRWIGPPDSESPAPQVTLTAAEDEGGGAAAPAPQQQAAAGGDSDDDGGSDTLSIIALIVGIAGLAAGVAALLLGRRRTRVGAA
jgi:Domain of unkown function (DUF1775)